MTINPDCLAGGSLLVAVVGLAITRRASFQMLKGMMLAVILLDLAAIGLMITQSVWP